MRNNLSILQTNTCDGLSDEAQALYLRADSRNEHRALYMASAWDDRIAPTLGKIMDEYYGGSPAARAVYEFARERHFRKYFPDGRSA